MATETPRRSDAIAAYGLVALYCGLQIALTVAHAPWADEAQAWLWAKSMSWPVQFFILPGEGHPPLWYWLLRALSGVLDFSQARYVTLPIAMFNACLLLMLLRGQFLLLAMMLFSLAILLFWGYNFRPYSIVMLALLGALLLDRKGHPIAATWILAVACGFHFFSGFLFAFWLVLQLRKGTRLSALLAPSALALIFGALAVLSGMGNAGLAGPPDNLLQATLSNLGWSFVLHDMRQPITGLLTLALLAYGLRKELVVLAALLVSLIVFATATAAVYGQYPWHFAFMTMLCFMAFTVTAPRSTSWVLLLLLAPQSVLGISAAIERLGTPVWAQPNLYSLIILDAGPDFDPSRQLVAWPDTAGLATAATQDIVMIGGNNGARLGPFDWRQSDLDRIDPALLTMQRPYWIICTNCAPLLTSLTGPDRKTTLIGQTRNPGDGLVSAYRLD